MIEPLKIQVRFRDCDSLGHVNNAVYLSFLEQARIHYFEPFLGKDFSYATDGFLLARNEIDYKLPILLNDEVQVELWVSRIGNRSFDLRYKIFNREKVFSEAKSILVAFNTQKNKAIEIHPKVRKALEAMLR